MGSKLGFILSTFFVVMVLCYSGDFYAMQAAHSYLEGMSTVVANKISLEGGLTSEMSNYLKNKNVEFHSNSQKMPKVGEVYEFTLSRVYHPMAISDSSITVTVYRSTVIGYLD